MSEVVDNGNSLGKAWQMKTWQGYLISPHGSTKKSFDWVGPKIICVAVLK
jgi:hypothetical protein